MRISSIDVGSNAIRQVIVEILPTGQWITLKKFRAPLRLGQDVFSHGYIQPQTEKELISVFKKMVKLNKKFKIQKSIALATSAMRDATNNSKVISNVRKTTGLQIKTISGQIEAKLIQLSIIKSNIINFPYSLLIDIGGGSAEFSVIENNKILYSQSFPIGVVRLLQQTQNNNTTVVEIIDPILKKIENKILNNLSLKNKDTPFQIAIGTGGNFDALSKLKIQLLKKSPNTNLSKKEIQEIYQIWKSLTFEEKLNLNIRSDRIDVLPLAIEFILYTLDLFHIEQIKIPLTGLKEGAIYSLIDKSSKN